MTPSTAAFLRREITMPFISMDDPQCWARCPKELEPVVRGGLTGLAYFELGEKKDNPPTVVALRMGPGWVLPRHAHDCYRFEIVAQGTLDVGERILKPGDVMVSAPGLPTVRTWPVPRAARPLRFSATTGRHMWRCLTCRRGGWSTTSRRRRGCRSCGRLCGERGRPQPKSERNSRPATSLGLDERRRSVERGLVEACAGKLQAGFCEGEVGNSVGICQISPQKFIEPL